MWMRTGTRLKVTSVVTQSASMIGVPIKNVIVPGIR